MQVVAVRSPICGGLLPFTPELLREDSLHGNITQPATVKKNFQTHVPGPNSLASG